MDAGIRTGAAVATLLLHGFALYEFLRLTAPAAPPPPQAVTYVLTATKLRGGGERIVSVDITPALATRGAACAGSSYVGIGITADPRTDRIILVGDDTPASRAGLRHDDIVLNPVVWRDAHVEGRLLRVEILREGYRLVLPVLVGKICIG
jgi:hypothetical protein